MPELNLKEPIQRLTAWLGHFSANYDFDERYITTLTQLIRTLHDIEKQQPFNMDDLYFLNIFVSSSFELLTDWVKIENYEESDIVNYLEALINLRTDVLKAYEGRRFDNVWER